MRRMLELLGTEIMAKQGCVTSIQAYLTTAEGVAYESARRHCRADGSDLVHHDVPPFLSMTSSSRQPPVS